MDQNALGAQSALNDAVDSGADPPDFAMNNFPPLPKSNSPALLDSRLMKKARVRGRSGEPIEQPRFSFRDMVNKDRAHVEVLSDGEEEEAEATDDVTIDFERRVPDMQFSSHFFSTLLKPWNHSVVVKLMGRPIGYMALYNRLASLWPNMRGGSMMDLENNYYLVKFNTQEEVMQALVGGPWVIMGHYLHVQPWNIDFDVNSNIIQSVIAWVRLPGMPVHCYHKKVFQKIGSIVGKVIKMDYQTAAQTRGKFARIAVELDLSKPLCAEFTIMGKIQCVEYENLPEICFHCGIYGYSSAICPAKKGNAPTDGGEGERGFQAGNGDGGADVLPAGGLGYGPWMVAQKMGRPLIRRDKIDPDWVHKNTNNLRSDGSRFVVLREENAEDGKASEISPASREKLGEQMGMPNKEGERAQMDTVGGVEGRVWRPKSVGAGKGKIGTTEQNIEPIMEIGSGTSKQTIQTQTRGT